VAPVHSGCQSRVLELPAAGRILPSPIKRQREPLRLARPLTLRPCLLHAATPRSQQSTSHLERRYAQWAGASDASLGVRQPDRLLPPTSSRRWGGWLNPAKHKRCATAGSSGGTRLVTKARSGSSRSTTSGVSDSSHRACRGLPRRGGHNRSSAPRPSCRAAAGHLGATPPRPTRADPRSVGGSAAGIPIGRLARGVVPAPGVARFRFKQWDIRWL
jgi:hypothetical protein